MRREIGIFGLDLGGTTGVATWHGWLGDRKLPIAEELKAGVFWGGQVACGGTVEGERAGTLLLRQMWRDWVNDTEIEESWLVMEDFVMRGRVGSTDRVGLSSARLAALVEGALLDELDANRIARYSPSRSKGYASSERLKKWGLWTVGKPHARDAAKQVAIHAAVLREA